LTSMIVTTAVAVAERLSGRPWSDATTRKRRAYGACSRSNDRVAVMTPVSASTWNPSTPLHGNSRLYTMSAFSPVSASAADTFCQRHTIPQHFFNKHSSSSHGQVLATLGKRTYNRQAARLLLYHRKIMAGYVRGAVYRP